MQPRKIGELKCEGGACDVFIADDPGAEWVAFRLHDLILVRSLGDRVLEMAIARSFAMIA